MSKKMNRRSFAKTALFTCGLAGLLAAGRACAPLLKPEEKFLRPPGAENERKFLGTCIKCGQCVQVCPYRSVKLLDINKGAAAGTPVIIPEERACYLCDLLPCVLSCPSGALDSSVSDAEYVDMGKARVVRPENCLGMKGETVTEDMINRLIAHGTSGEREKELAEKLRAFSGKACTVCRDMCPYPDRDAAIALTGEKRYAPEIREKCVGCGVCLELCPAESNVFVIEPK